MSGARDEHRPLVVSSWPLYLAQGEIVTAIDSKARRIADFMPVTTPEEYLALRREALDRWRVVKESA